MRNVSPFFLKLFCRIFMPGVSDKNLLAPERVNVNVSLSVPQNLRSSCRLGRKVPHHLNDIPNKRVKVPRPSVFSDSSDDSAALRLLWEEQMENSSRLTSSGARAGGGRGLGKRGADAGKSVAEGRSLTGRYSLQQQGDGAARQEAPEQVHSSKTCRSDTLSPINCPHRDRKHHKTHWESSNLHGRTSTGRSCSKHGPDVLMIHMWEQSQRGL